MTSAGRSARADQGRWSPRAEFRERGRSRDVPDDTMVTCGRPPANAGGPKAWSRDRQGLPRPRPEEGTRPALHPVGHREHEHPDVEDGEHRDHGPERGEGPAQVPRAPGSASARSATRRTATSRCPGRAARTGAPGSPAAAAGPSSPRLRRDPDQRAGRGDDRAALAQEVEQVVGDVPGDVERDQRVAEAGEVLPRGLGVAAARDPGGDRQQRDRGARSRSRRPA